MVWFWEIVVWFWETDEVEEETLRPERANLTVLPGALLRCTEWIPSPATKTSRAPAPPFRISHSNLALSSSYA